MPNSKKNKFLHALSDDAKKIQPDILEIEASASPNPFENRVRIDAKWVKRQKERRFKK